MAMEPIRHKPTREERAIAVQNLRHLADVHRKDNEFVKSISLLNEAIDIADQTERGQLYLKLARVHNGAGADLLYSSNNREGAMASYMRALELFEEAQREADLHDPNLLLKKNIALQKYFNMKGVYQINPEKLDSLVAIRESAISVFEEVLEQAQQTIDPQEQTLSDPESGKTIGMLMHELAFLIEDRPEGEDLPLSKERRRQLQRSVDLYTEALPFREGDVRAMTFSRRLAPRRKLGDIDGAMSDLEEATQMYIAAPDGQRLNILDGDIATFLLIDGLTVKQKARLEELGDLVREAKDPLR